MFRLAQESVIELPCGRRVWVRSARTAEGDFTDRRVPAAVQFLTVDVWEASPLGLAQLNKLTAK